MRIIPKLSLTFVLAALFPLLTIGYAGMYFLGQLGERAIVTSRANAIESEKIRLQQLAADKALIVQGFLSEYHRDVLLLQNQYERICSLTPLLENSFLRDVYADRDTAG
ncbi:MAG TPA: hypothetical protein PKM25_07385, partial [Candidatus Ozemobacteraceae bacterium]|nr:hypothetical protein [Candidatus Ozemobacteraceae bacterium]